MYKVFINDKPVIFTSGDDFPANDTETRVITAGTPEKMRKIFHQFIAEDEIRTLVFAGNLDSRQQFEDFVSLFRYLEAAGGIVRNRNDERLFIHRFGKWDLPKGKIEKGETPVMAALREVTEETGLTQQYILEELPSTYHIYEHKGRMILKRTYWFVMEYSGEEQPVPQTEESITDARWFPQHELEAILHNTYASLCDLIQADILYRRPGA